MSLVTTLAREAPGPGGRPAGPGPLRWLRAARRTVRRFSHAVRFHADRYVADPPPGVEERWITTADGVRLHAWYAPAREARPTLVWSHGNGVSIARRPGVLRALAEQGLGVLAYDYRGCGRSGGRPSEKGLYRDALAAYENARRDGVPPAHIVCFGESLGGAVSIFLASRRPCAGVAAVSTFTRLADMYRGFGPLGLIARFDSLARIRRLSVPILIAHGDRDEMIRFELGERLFAAAKEPKRFVRVPGAHHSNVLASAALLDEIAAFAIGATR
jgi:fermentation-respiration switch protein FrsA (DUF1100 family)